MNESDPSNADPLDWERAADYVHELRADRLPHQGLERVPIDHIGGRTLAESIDAPESIPNHSYATMDGFAFDAAEEYPLRIVDGVFPEDTPGHLGDGEAVRIATGAPLPESATAVLRREDATVEGNRLRGPDIAPGTYVYERASNVAEGERLFSAGDRLSPKDALLLGDLGIDDVTVYRPFDVATLATGTELHEGRQRDLDSPMLAGLVRNWGHDVTHEGTVPDEFGRVRDVIADVANEYDVVVTTGGTSVGKKDHVVRALEDLGEVIFHRVALRPGKPIAVARLEEYDAVVFAIPGKPVGAHAVTALVARPFFTGDSSLPTVTATVDVDLEVTTPGFTYAVPVTLSAGRAMPLGHVESPLSVYDGTFDPSVLSSSSRATRAAGFVLTERGLSAGETVSVVPYEVVER